VIQDLKDLQGNQDPREHQDQLDLRGHQASQAKWDNQDLLGLLEVWALVEPRVVLDSPEQLDRVETKEIQEVLELMG